MENREAINILNEIKQMDDSMYAYHPAYMEALNLAISALEKREAKRAEMGWDINFGKVRPHCPVCRESNPMEANYCWNCGQRIKTEEES